MVMTMSSNSQSDYEIDIIEIRKGMIAFLEKNLESMPMTERAVYVIHRDVVPVSTCARRLKDMNS